MGDFGLFTNRKQVVQLSKAPMTGCLCITVRPKVVVFPLVHQEHYPRRAPSETRTHLDSQLFTGKRLPLSVWFSRKTAYPKKGSHVTRAHWAAQQLRPSKPVSFLRTGSQPKGHLLWIDKTHFAPPKTPWETIVCQDLPGTQYEMSVLTGQLGIWRFELSFAASIATP